VTGRLIAWLGLVGALTAIAYGSRAASGKPETDAVYEYDLALAGIVQYGIMLGVVLLIAMGTEARALLALRRPASWWRAAGLSVVVLVGLYVLGGLLSPYLDPGGEQGLTPSGWDPDRAGAFAFNFAVIVLVAPFVEELTFRGLGYSLLEPFGRGLAIVAVGVAFGLVHGLVEALPILAAFGAGLAWIRARTGSLYPAIATHGVFNAIAIAIAVTT